MEHYADSTADQKELYIALLDIGGAMQRQLLGTTLLPNSTFNNIGFYADQYAVLRVATYLDGEYYGTSDECLYLGDSTQIVAAKSLEGAVFTGFADKDGNFVSEYGELTADSYNKYSLTLDSIGVTEYKQFYTTKNYTVNEFDGGTLTDMGIVTGDGTTKLNPTKKFFTTDKNGVASKTIVYVSACVAFSAKGTDKCLDFSKLIKTESATVYEDTASDTSGAYKAGEFIKAANYKVSDSSITMANTAAAENPAFYLFETDFTTYSSASVTYTTISLLNEDGSAIFSIGIKPRAAGSSFTFTVNDGETREINEASLKQNGENNLRVEFAPSEGDTASVKIYVNGKLCYENAEYTADAIAGDKDMTFSAVGFYHSDSANNVKLRLDSTVIATVPAE